MAKEREPHRRPNPFRGEGAPVPDCIHELLDHLEPQVAASQNDGIFRRFLDVQACFHHYSPCDVGLILF